MIEANEQVHARAQELLRRGRPVEALRLFRQLLQHTHVVDYEYDEWLAGAVEAFRLVGRLEEVGHILVYLQRFAEARAAFPASATVDQARCRELEARRAPPAVAETLYLEAARGYLDAGKHVLAALAYATAGSAGVRDARKAWERVFQDPRLRARAYEQALVHYNLGLAARREEDRSAATRHLVQAQRLLEEVADDFEARGERERAFDCYMILLQIGKDSGSYENIAEGYINCIRVLKEDNLKFYVLQYYEDFIRLSLEREEFHAAAMMFREAADYARRVGLLWDRGYLKRAAETWWKAAEKNERDGGPVELTENAYLASIDNFNSIGDFGKIRESYVRLSSLPLPDKKKQRYARVATRYGDGAGEPVDAATIPEALRQPQAYPPIWGDDLVEWELDGDPAAVCAWLVGDFARYPNMIRRRALNVILLRLESRNDEDPNFLGQIARSLGELQAYPALRPLEKLYGHGHATVRAGVMKALKRLYFKRTFVLVARGLRDESREVRDAAVEAVAQLRFAAAFDPLVRIFREHDDVNVRQTALESLGHLATLEAGEFLIEVLRFEPEPLRSLAQRLLAQFEHHDIFPILRRHLEMESGPARQQLERILRGARG